MRKFLLSVLAIAVVLPTAWADDLIIGTIELPRNFNPYFEHSQIENVINGLVYDGMMEQVAINRDPEKSYEKNLAEILQPGRSGSGVFSGTFQVRLRSGVAFHRSSGSLGLADVEKTISGIEAIEENLYHGRRLAFNPRGNLDFELTVGHPKVGDGRESTLFMHLTFPIVRGPERPDQQIDSPGQERYIDGPGPFLLEKYDLVTNKIVLTRFSKYFRGAGAPPRKEEIERVVIEFVDIYEDLVDGFKSGRFHVLLNYVGNLAPPAGKEYQKDPSPYLNSFTYLGFNRNVNYYGGGRELFQDQFFRRLVWHSLNEDVYNMFTLGGRGERLHSLEKLINPDNQRYLVIYGSEFTDDKLRESVEDFFAQRPSLNGRMITLKCKGFVPDHCRLATRVHRRLKEVFGGHVDFGDGPEPVTQEMVWRENVVGQRDFDLLIDTYYYGINAKILNLAFLTLGSALNLTGARVDPRRYMEQEVLTRYDQFLIDVNNRAEVVVLGAFKRYNVLDKTPFEVNQKVGSPLLYNLYNWKSRGEDRR